LNKQNKNNKKRGSMLVELLIAASIITTSVLVIMNTVQGSSQASRQALHTLQASFLLEEAAEAVRTIRDNNWSDVSGLIPAQDYYLVFSPTTGTWSLLNTAEAVGSFTRKINVTNVMRDNVTANISSTGTLDPNTKMITVIVSWQEGGKTISKTISFYLMNIFS
jgi:type II secretory pathway pseudopilin PulG